MDGDLEQVKKSIVHFPDFEEVKKLIVILLNLNKSIHFKFISLSLNKSKTQITTNTGALIYCALDDSVAELIKHKVSNILTYREMSLNPVRNSVLEKPLHRRKGSTC